jgi:hypothetical protein
MAGMTSNEGVFMSSEMLGKLEKAALRSVWNNEARDFTPWLAQNLGLLGDSIGLELEGQERSVGPFRADILCKDTANDTWVLIENQLEKTDHGHLGQLLTYAAGLDAATIIWVAERFTDEHRAALDWLNRITAEHFNFFGLEVEVWKIGDSQPAPKFNVVSQPNDWSKTVANAKAGGFTATEEMQFEFWQGLIDYQREHGHQVVLKKARPQQWVKFGVGTTGFHLGASINTRLNTLVAGLYITHNDAKASFATLLSDQAAIEAEVSSALIWDENPNKKWSQIEIELTADIGDRDDWPRQFEWLAVQLTAFHKAFSLRIKEIGNYGVAEG